MLGKRSAQRGLFEAGTLYGDFVGKRNFYGYLASQRMSCSATTTLLDCIATTTVGRVCRRACWPPHWCCKLTTGSPMMKPLAEPRSTCSGR